MLVCPDFFPLAKLNNSRQNRKSTHDVEVPLDLVDIASSRQKPDGDELGFYGNQSQIPPEMLTNMEDSYVEDPNEQFLYSSQNNSEL